MWNFISCFKLPTQLVQMVVNDICVGAKTYDMQIRNFIFSDIFFMSREERITEVNKTTSNQTVE